MADTPRRVLVIASEHVAERMAGPAIRSLNLARELARAGLRVTLATPERQAASGRDLSAEPFAHVTFGAPSMRGFRALADGFDVVVAQPQRVDVAAGLAASGAAVVYDLYVPSFVERIAQLAGEPGSAQLHRRLLERDRLEYATAIERGDAFICASERQRDHWLGALAQAGRLDLDLLGRDPRGDALCGIVPFGVGEDPPALADGGGAIRGTLAPDDSIVLLWTGGLWNWFDPVSVVEALERARRVEPRLRLVVLGMRHPEAAWQEQDAARALRTRAEELGLLENGGVVLHEEWVPYDERHRFLLDADAAVSAHRDTLETRLSFRTRFLDHLWAGLPTISTEGGELTDRMAAIGAARTVGEGDVDAWVEALLELAEDVALRRSMGDAARELAEAYRWPRAAAPLVAIVHSIELGARDRTPARRRRPGALLRYAALLVRIRVQAKGLGSLGRAVRDATGRSRS